MDQTTRPRAATTSPERTEPPLPDPVRSVYEAVDVRPLLRWLLERAGDMGLTFESHSPTDSRESYCDTPDWRLHRAGYTLRICAGPDHVLGILGRIAGSGEEPNLPVTEAFGSVDPGSFRSGSGLVAEALTALLGARPVVRHVEFRRQGESYHLRSGERVLATLSLVNVFVPLEGSDDPVRLSRFEVRTADDPFDPVLTQLLEAAQRACGLRPVQVSVFDSALLASGITPTKSPDLGSEIIEPGRPVGDVALAVLRTHFRRMLAHEPGTRLGDDIEDLHAMRVSGRRLRAAFSLYRKVLPARGKTLLADLRWLGRALGEVRDLDVQLAWLRGWREEVAPDEAVALGVIEEILLGRRRDARRRLLKVLDSRRYDRFVERSGSFLRHGPVRRSPVARLAITTVAPELISGRYRSVQKARRHITPASPPEPYHRLRILVKRLRYACEFHRDVYGKKVDRVVSAVTNLQDLLGEHQDACVAMEWLAELVERERRRFSTSHAFALGKLAERLQGRAEQLRAKFPNKSKQLGGRRWKRLRRAMDAANRDGPGR